MENDTGSNGYDLDPEYGSYIKGDKAPPWPREEDVEGQPLWSEGEDPGWVLLLRIMYTMHL